MMVAICLLYALERLELPHVAGAVEAVKVATAVPARSRRFFAGDLPSPRSPALEKPWCQASVLLTWLESLNPSASDEV